MLPDYRVSAHISWLEVMFLNHSFLKHSSWVTKVIIQGQHWKDSRIPFTFQHDYKLIQGRQV